MERAKDGKSLLLWFYRGDFMIKGWLHWAAARAILPWSPDMGGGGSWLFWDRWSWWSDAAGEWRPEQWWGGGRCVWQHEWTKAGRHLYFFFFFSNIFLAFIDRIAEECDRKRGKRGGVTRSKGIQAGSWTQVRCRASAQGSRTLPTELSGALTHLYLKGSSKNIG